MKALAAALMATSTTTHQRRRRTHSDSRSSSAHPAGVTPPEAAARNRIMLAPDLTCQATAWPPPGEQRALASQSGEVPFEEGGDARIGDEAVAQLDQAVRSEERRVGK